VPKVQFVQGVSGLDDLFGVGGLAGVGQVEGDVDAADWPGDFATARGDADDGGGLEVRWAGEGTLPSIVPSGSGARSRCLLASPGQMLRHDSPETSST
jgi:hypothetical protein